MVQTLLASHGGDYTSRFNKNSTIGDQHPSRNLPVSKQLAVVSELALTKFVAQTIQVMYLGTRPK